MCRLACEDLEMWPFKKKEKLPDARQLLIQVRNEKIDSLSKKYPIGSKFSYLGVDCMVTHTSVYFTDYTYIDYIGVFPAIGVEAALKADYVDKNGVVRCLSLSFDEAMRLNT
jgi:hypothetical protein